MGIKNRLTSLLKEKGMNINELASKIDVTPSTLYSIVQRDSTRIDIDLILKIAHALGVTADELLSEEISRAESVDANKARLLMYYERLNQEGRDRLLEQAEFFASQERYQQNKDTEELG